VVDRRCDDAGTHPAPAQRQSKDGGLIRVDPGSGEDDLIRSRSYSGGNHFSCLVNGLGGKPARPVQTCWIAPARLLRIEPSLARIGEHWLARRTVQEDLGDGMRHASKLAHESLVAGADAAVDRPKPNPYTGDDSVVLR
jgi:hypothetical protein